MKRSQIVLIFGGILVVLMSAVFGLFGARIPFLQSNIVGDTQAPPVFRTDFLTLPEGSVLKGASLHEGILKTGSGSALLILPITLRMPFPDELHFTGAFENSSETNTVHLKLRDIFGNTWYELNVTPTTPFVFDYALSTPLVQKLRNTPRLQAEFTFPPDTSFALKSFEVSEKNTTVKGRQIPLE